jgi:hypothetical protein
MTNDVMTISEMESLFPSEWVLIGDPHTDKYQGVLSGRVIFHSKDRNEVDRQALQLPPPRNVAFHFTGPSPAPGMRVLL